MADCECSNTPCDCNDLVEPRSGLENLSAGASTVIGARVTKGTARALGRFCHSRGCSQSEALRLALKLLSAQSSASPQKPEDLIGALADVLALPATATPSDVLAAVQEIVASLSPAGEVQSETPPPAQSPEAPAAMSRRRALTKAEREGCKRLNISEQEFWSRYDEAVQIASPKPAPVRAARAAKDRYAALSDADRRALSRRGISREQFNADAENAVRRG